MLVFSCYLCKCFNEHATFADYPASMPGLTVLFHIVSGKSIVAGCSGYLKTFLPYNGNVDVCPVIGNEKEASIENLLKNEEHGNSLWFFAKM